MKKRKQASYLRSQQGTFRFKGGGETYMEHGATRATAHLQRIPTALFPPLEHAAPAANRETKTQTGRPLEA